MGFPNGITSGRYLPLCYTLTQRHSSIPNQRHQYTLDEDISQLCWMCSVFFVTVKSPGQVSGTLITWAKTAKVLELSH